MRYLYKILAAFLFVAYCTSLFAQVRTVTFTGRDRTNQYHIPLSQVKVFNLDQLWEEVLYYPDTILVLGSVGVEDYETGQNLQLMQNVPNPFDGTTEFALQLPDDRDVLLEIYDITGHLAVGEKFAALSAGTHLFQATLSSPQTYLLSAKVDNGQMTIKMVNTGYGAKNTIRHLGMTDKNGDFTIYLKNDKASSGYPFHVGDEMQYIGSAVVDERLLESEVVTQAQVDNETLSLLFDVTVPTVTTRITSVSATSADGGGFVTNSGGSPVTMRGICWSTFQNPTIADNHTDDGSGTGSFNSTMTDLTPNTTYYLRAYATNSVGTGYGEQRTFTTACNPVNVNITGNTNINYGQSTTLTASGADNYQWSTGATISSITLSPSSTTTYTVTGTNSYGCTATASVTVTVNPVAPTVTTNNVSNIQATSATCGGNVTSHGGAAVTARGVCWSTSPNPTISGSHTTNGSSTGTFTSSLTGLTPNTTYYVRAYATNSAGTACGEQKSFITPCNTVNVNIAGSTTINYGQSTTLTASGANSYQWSTNATTANITVSPTTTTTYTVTGTNSYGCTATASVTVTVNPVAPTVTTNNVSNIQATSATCGGNVTSHGGAAVTARGVCWSTSPNPTISGSHTTNGSSTGTFTSSLTGLTPNTTYYVRAYATNSAGTAYGPEVSFTTIIIDSKSCPANPTVTDHEGNVYATVQIGNQCWMRDNLRTTTSPSTGTYLIPSAGTDYTYTGKQACWYNNDSTTYAPQNYGLLYNWNAAVDTFNTAYGETSVNTSQSNAVTASFSGPRRGICPAGWHLPSDAEWTALTNYVSSQSEYICGDTNINIAKALADSTGWYTSTNTCAVGNTPGNNNATGFSAFPTGLYNGSYGNFGVGATFWSSTAYYSSYACVRYLEYYYADVYRSSARKNIGYSVRCLCDAAADVIDTLHLHDLGILSMLNPTTRCDLGLESIVLTITNNGTQDLLPGTAMHYSINGLPAVNETLTDTLHSHETKTFRFNTQFDFTNNLIESDSNYSILVWATKDAQDRLQYNDTLRQTIASRGKSALPIVQDQVNISYYTRGTLTAHLPSSITQGVIGWYANTGYETWEFLGYTDSTYQTPYIFFDTTFYANANPGYIFDTIVGNLTGSTTGNGAQPFVFTKGYSRGRILYTENEIGQHGPITSIGVYVNSITNVGDDGIPIKLYLKETSMASFPSNASIDWDNEVLDATLIVDEMVHFDHVGWHYFTLSTPFNYNSGNLIVLTETNCADYCTGTGTQCNNCGAFVSGGTGYPNFRQTNCAAGFVQYKDNNTLPMTGSYSNYTKRLTMSFKINNLDCGSEMVPIHIHVPDIPTYDVYTVSLDYPSSGCALYDEHIQVTIKNMLNVPIPAGKVNVHAIINGTIITETINEIILPEKSKTVTFSQPYDFSAPYNNNTFNYVIYTTMNNEGVVYTRNDTISGQITSIHTAGLQDSYTYVGSYMNSMTILQPNDRLSDVLFYYFFDSSGTLIHTTSATVPYYTTPALYDSAVFWVAAKTKTSNCITRRVPVYINVGMPTAVIDSKSCPAAPTVTDHEGNVYATVQIGNQCWMRDNLRTTTSPSTGTYLIPAVGTGLTYTGKQARWYNNDSTTYAPMNYGLLYNWNAAVDTFNTVYGESSLDTDYNNSVWVSFSGNRRGICPAGWHLPSNAEWTTMINFVSSQSEYVCGDTNINIAKALADSTGWVTYNNNCAVGNDPSGNNATGFSALPAGIYFGNYYNSGGDAVIWSSTTGDGISAGQYSLSYFSAIVSWNGAVHKNGGFSVRCLRDATADCSSFAAAILGDTAFCAGDSVTLYAMASGATPPVAVGDILCTDNTIVKPADWPVAGKTALGVVFYVDDTGLHGWAVHLNNQSTSIQWGGYGTDIPDLPNFTTSRAALADTAGYGNTVTIRAYGDASTYPAAWAVDLDNGWYLPAAGQLRRLYGVIPTLNATLSTLGGTQFPMNSYWYYWSSTEYNANSAWHLYDRGDLYSYFKNLYYRVRSVRAF